METSPNTRGSAPGGTPGTTRPSGLWAWIAGRRRTLLVVGFQRRYVLAQLTWLVVSMAFLTGALFTPSIIAVLQADPETRLDAANQFLALHDLAWPVMALVLPLVSLVMVFNTHRLAGPLYRFRLVFDDVGRGILSMHVRTRRADYLTDEAAGLDRMVASLRTRISSAQTEIAQARSDLNQFARREQFAPGSGVAALSESIARAEAVLDQFETGRDASRADHSEGGTVNEAEPLEGSPPSAAPRSRGFTLIEMLIVLAMVAIVAVIAVPAYSAALETARVTRATGDMKAIEREANVQRLLKGCFPSSLADMKLDYLRDPWGRPYTYGVISQGGGGGPALCTACSAACIPSGQERTDSNLVPLNVDFDVYSLGRNGLSAAPVSAPESADDVVRASGGGYFGLGRDY